jgi:predicted thioesterase
MDLTPGMTATVETTVGESDTAVALGSGDVDVLGTPAIVALCEAAAVKAISGALEPGRTSVGTGIQLDHLAPTPVGGKVVARAELVEVDGRTLRFTVAALDHAGDVAGGTHTRVVVDRAMFVERAAAR